MRISDWSSDVCSSDLVLRPVDRGGGDHRAGDRPGRNAARRGHAVRAVRPGDVVAAPQTAARRRCGAARVTWDPLQQEVLEALGHTVYRATGPGLAPRSEEHTSELQSLMRLSYAVFCLKKK